MVNCKDCKKSEVGKDGRVCYIKAMHYQNIHVSDDDSCKYGILKDGITQPVEQPQKTTEDKKEPSQPVTPKVEEKATTDTKEEDKQGTKENNVTDNSKDANKNNISSIVK